MKGTCSIALRQADESTARLRLAIGDAENRASWSGTLRGPFCESARTLAADFPVAADGTLLVTEPCYWTPRLPFTYELQAVAEVQGRRVAELQETVGLRRLEIRGRHLFWERRRIVLRGGRADTRAKDVLTDARDFETALLVANPPAEFCKQASTCGVPLIVDFRNCGAPLYVELASATAHPAVVAALVDGHQVDSTVRFPSDAIAAQAVYADDRSELASWAAIAVCEIEPEQRPPPWLATCDRPVIALCNSTDHRLEDARRRCDRLQARLAPEFELAGYFA